VSNTCSVAQLQVDWIKLSDLDRAKAIRAIKQSGHSIRKIASVLHISESLLRHLLIALQAPIEDRVLAHQGKISTNELVRRAKAAGLERIARHREVLALERTKSSRKAARLICNWIADTDIYGPDGERIIDDVRREFDLREVDGSLPPPPVNLELPLAELIQRCRPKWSPDNNASSVTWYTQWLCRWAFFAFPDEDIRDSALDLALERQWRR
jgi:hypothetical protein